MTTEWKLVPVVPTEMMLRAANGCSDRFPAAREWVDQENCITYQTMLCAAPDAPQPPSQWPPPRPMSEAPKDKGSKVLAWWPASTEWIASWWWPERNCWLCALSECDEPQPTCWLPMPAAPAEQEVTK